MTTTVRYTVANGEVLSENRSGVSKFYVPDPLGSTQALLDNTQAQTDTFTYWPYGEVNMRTGTTPTPFQFVGTHGYYNDSSTRAYVRARYLDLGKGRWLTKDPIGFEGKDFNLYRYVGNKAATVIDPMGNAIKPPPPPKPWKAQRCPRFKLCPPAPKNCTRIPVFLGVTCVSVNGVYPNTDCCIYNLYLVFYRGSGCSSSTCSQLVYVGRLLKSTCLMANPTAKRHCFARKPIT